MQWFQVAARAAAHHKSCSMTASAVSIAEKTTKYVSHCMHTGTIGAHDQGPAGISRAPRAHQQGCWRQSMLLVSQILTAFQSYRHLNASRGH